MSDVCVVYLVNTNILEGIIDAIIPHPHAYGCSATNQYIKPLHAVFRELLVLRLPSLEYKEDRYAVP